jgi:c(7)-type cytochrome triheme protein
LKKILILAGILSLVVAFAVGAQVGGGNITMKTSFGPVIFSHENHAAKGLSCQSCHPEHYLNVEGHKTVTMKEMEDNKSCGLCHNDGKRAFTVKANCNTCHKK